MGISILTYTKKATNPRFFLDKWKIQTGKRKNKKSNKQERAQDVKDL